MGLFAALAFPGGQAGRQVLEKEEREPLRWKRGKTGRRKKKRESPMNILEKIQARASEVVVVVVVVLLLGATEDIGSTGTLDGRVLHTSFHRMAALCLWVNLDTSLDEFFAKNTDFADNHHVTAIHNGFDIHLGERRRNRLSLGVRLAHSPAGRTGRPWRAGGHWRRKI